LEFSVSPIQATIIMFFQEKEIWTLNELATKIEVSPDILKKRISFWLNNGILKEIEKNVYKLADNPINSSEPAFQAEEEKEEPVSASQAQKEETMKIVENFCFGMLKTFGSLSADRIQAMLTSYVDTYTWPIHELGEFLNQLTKDHKIDCSGGNYSLHKK